MPAMWSGVAPPVLTSLARSGWLERRAASLAGALNSLFTSVYPPPAVL